MPETRVPMTLREHFLQDPFFKSAWDDMERMRGSFFQSSSMNMLESSGQQQREEVTSNQEKSLANRSEDRFGKWLVPRTWMLPSLLDSDKMTKMTDSSVLSYSDSEHKLEISLNTSGYKAEEIKVNINGDELCVEGRHEEKSEAGHVMVARQFTKSYSLPQGAIKEKVESNLSQDGVLVITVPKEKKIQEIKNEARNIAVEHKNTKAAAENINVERKSSAGSMDRERKLSSGSAERKISTGSMERKSSMEKKSSMERKSSFSGSSSSSTLGSEKSKKTTSMVPMNLRDSFFDDPFFQDNWLDIQKTQKNFFTQAQEQFRQQRERMESSMNESMNISNFFDKDFALSKFDDDFDFFKFNKDFGFSKMSLKDAHELSVKETEESLEIKLDTAGFKPDELRVTAGSGVICVEGKHEEKTEKGESMVSRMMSRQYPLPAQARPSDVVSNLSKDGILVVTVPKSKQIKQGERNVPIEMNN